MSRNYSATAQLTITEKILLEVLYAIVYLISLLPFCILYLFSDGLYLLVYKITGYRKKVVRKNLRNSFPEKSQEELKEIETGFYHFFCDYIFETIKLASISKEEMNRRVKYSGLENMRKPLSEGHGIGLYLGHYCNWEWGTSIGLHIPDGAKGCQVYHVLESKVMDKLMLRLRVKMGTDNFSKTDVLKRLVQFRQQNTPYVIGLISDQSPVIYNIPYWTEFLNQDTAFITGSERIIKRLKMACVYYDISRVRRGFYHVNLITLAEAGEEIPDWELTERYARTLEKAIRRQPELWLWSHNRWKRNRDSFINADKKPSV